MATVGRRRQNDGKNEGGKRGPGVSPWPAIRVLEFPKTSQSRARVLEVISEPENNAKGIKMRILSTVLRERNRW